MTLKKGCYVTVSKILVFRSSPRIFEWRYPHYHRQTCRHSDSIGPVSFIQIFTRVASRLRGDFLNYATYATHATQDLALRTLLS